MQTMMTGGHRALPVHISPVLEVSVNRIEPEVEELWNGWSRKTLDSKRLEKTKNAEH